MGQNHLEGNSNAPEPPGRKSWCVRTTWKGILMHQSRLTGHSNAPEPPEGISKKFSMMLTEKQNMAILFLSEKQLNDCNLCTDVELCLSESNKRRRRSNRRCIHWEFIKGTLCHCHHSSRSFVHWRKCRSFLLISGADIKWIESSLRYSPSQILCNKMP